MRSFLVHNDANFNRPKINCWIKNVFIPHPILRAFCVMASFVYTMVVIEFVHLFLTTIQV